MITEPVCKLAKANALSLRYVQVRILSGSPHKPHIRLRARVGQRVGYGADVLYPPKHGKKKSPDCLKFGLRMHLPDLLEDIRNTPALFFRFWN